MFKDVESRNEIRIAHIRSDCIPVSRVAFRDLFQIIPAPPQPRVSLVRFCIESVVGNTTPSVVRVDIIERVKLERPEPVLIYSDDV